MKTATREVIDLFLEFLLSIFLCSGAGFLLFYGIAVELASGVIMMIAVYWFQKRSNESAVNNLLRQAPDLQNIQDSNATPTTTPTDGKAL